MIMFATSTRTVLINITVHIICVDESMSRWYGIGGNWIDASLPQNIEIDRKSENSCDI